MEVKRQQQGIYGAWRKNLTAKKKAGKASRLDIPIQEKAEETAVVDLLTQDKS
jgi:chitodextrinase